MTEEDRNAITEIVAASEQRTVSTIATAMRAEIKASEQRNNATIAAAEESTVSTIATTMQAEIKASEQRNNATISAAEERIVSTIATTMRAEIKASEERAQEFARTIETSLLTAFHGYAKGQTARLHTAESTAHDFAVRLAAIEERLLNLETRRQ